MIAAIAIENMVANPHVREHAMPRKLPNVMIEIRNDLIATEEAQRAMAEVLAAALIAAHPALAPRGRADA